MGVGDNFDVVYRSIHIINMLYKFCLLPFLALASSSETKHVDATTKERLVQHAREKLPVVPKSFAGKVAKYHGKPGANSGATEHIQTADVSQHLRALSMKDNFVSYTEYSDAACTQQVVTFGSLVNYCFNEKDTATGVKQSRIIKTAKKDSTLVELTYEGHDCHGVPAKVEDIMKNMFVGYTNWGDCFEMEGSWYTVNYLSTYPDRDYMNSIPDTYAVFTFPEDRCTDSNKYYFEYSQFPLSWLDFPGGCVEAGGGYYYTLDYSECEESHTLTGIFYMNSDCSGDPSFTYPLLPVCEGDDDDDYDDGNDDDDNWEYTHSLESYYCT